MQLQRPIPNALILALALCLGLYSSVSTAEEHEPDSSSAVTPATPYEFAKMYGAASEAMSAEAVASLYSDVLVSIPHTGDYSQMIGFEEQRAALDGFFSGLKERGITSLRLADFSINQISNDFAFARLRWELSTSPDVVVNTVMSTYVIRREENGWRAVSILEMGGPQAP